MKIIDKKEFDYDLITTAKVFSKEFYKSDLEVIRTDIAREINNICSLHGIQPIIHCTIEKFSSDSLKGICFVIKCTHSRRNTDAIRRCISEACDIHSDVVKIIFTETSVENVSVWYYFNDEKETPNGKV